jgi:enoyl-CoA hydratase/carnithine racemase
MTGRIFDGQEAKELGLVTRVADDPLEVAIALAQEIATKSPDSTALTKRLFQETWVQDEATALDTETTFQRKLLGSWNQIVQTGSNFGVSLPFMKRGKE